MLENPVECLIGEEHAEDRGAKLSKACFRCRSFFL
jgi:hypothetical protein